MKKFDNDLESSIQMYLQNTMSEEQAIEFEDYYVNKPHVIEKIETARAMKQGIRINQPQLAESLKPSKVRVTILSSILSWLRGPVPGYSLAAVAFTLLGFTFLMPNQPTEQLTLLNFSSTHQRNIVSDIVIELDYDSAPQAALIKVASVNYRKYELALLDINNKRPIWQSPPFVFSALKDKMIVLPNNLAVKKVVIELYGVDVNGNKIAVPFCHYSETCKN